MQIRVKNQDDINTRVEVIDPSDGAITHTADLDLEEQITITATSAHSPADIDFGEVETIPSESEDEAPDPEPADEPEDGAPPPTFPPEGRGIADNEGEDAGPGAA